VAEVLNVLTCTMTVLILASGGCAARPAPGTSPDAPRSNPGQASTPIHVSGPQMAAHAELHKAFDFLKPTWVPEEGRSRKDKITEEFLYKVLRGEKKGRVVFAPLGHGRDKDVVEVVSKGPGQVTVYLPIGAAVGMVHVDEFIANRVPRRKAMQCRQSLKTIGTALEMYATDNKGAYPSSFDQLKPLYLNTIPECPSAGGDTYSGTYQLKKLYDTVEGYEVFCRGHFHEDVGLARNFPKYDSVAGISNEP
jgi:hypothetical protein